MFPYQAKKSKGVPVEIAECPGKNTDSSREGELGNGDGRPREWKWCNGVAGQE